MKDQEQYNDAIEQAQGLRKTLADQQASQARSVKVLEDTKEELMAQKEELTAAVEELSFQNAKLLTTLESLRQRNHEIDQIVYRASHDLRAPVTSLLGVNNLLHHYMDDSFIHECCGHIDFQLMKMNSLLNSLSSFAQVTISEPRVNNVDFDFILNDVIKECQRSPHSKNMYVHVDLQGNFKFQSDDHFIRVILYELIANAFTFRDYLKPGSLTVEARIADEILTLKITDKGDGISSEIRKEIFSMFYRGSDKSLGNGLGLYKVLKCVNSLGGSVTLNTELATQFIVSLPIVHDTP